MATSLDLSSNTLELVAIDRIVHYVDSSYSSLEYNKKRNDFDFTNKERTWALEHTSYISKSDIEKYKYDKAKSEGKNHDSSMIDGVLIDPEGDVLAYIGEGMTSFRKSLLKTISRKDKKCRVRKAKEPLFTRIELAITVPNEPLFIDAKSIKPLDEWINKLDNIFNKIFLIFYNSIFVFDGMTGEFEFISYKWITKKRLI